MNGIGARLVLVMVMLLAWFVGCSTAASGGANTASGPHFTASTGSYAVQFQASKGTLSITPRGKSASLTLAEMSGSKKLNLLAAVRKVQHKGNAWVLSGRSSWADFIIRVSLPKPDPGLVHLTLSLKLRKDPPSLKILPDVRLLHAPVSSLKQWTIGPPVAGTSVFLSDTALNSSIMYLADLTALGPYFERTKSGGGASNFSYPRARTEGALVGVQGAAFGYVPPPTSLGDLPHGVWTPVTDSYLYLVPGVPGDEASVAATYLKLLGTIYGVLPKPSLPAADWKAFADRAAVDLMAPANVVTINGLRYLRSYVSDTRSSPELITQAGVLAAVKIYEARYHLTVPLDAMLEQNLASFYDPAFHSVKNGLGHDPAAREESWYYITNLISLLQAAQNGSSVARKLLLDSIDGAIALAHTNNYEFPQSFRFADWNGKDTGLQPDVAGGYSWLMLGVHDLTGDGRYLDEARAAIAHIAGKGFDLTYETHMTAYSAAAAQRLFTLTGDSAYHADALLALANLWHVTRLWDCTYGLCRKGQGYHTYFGVNILPWGNYIAMLEQYEAWLGVRDYLQYAKDEPASVRSLAEGFVSNTPNMMQYALPPRLPAGTVPPAPGLYDFVPRNNLAWYIPVEDLQVGEKQSGTIGQELYGAGGTFVFAGLAG